MALHGDRCVVLGGGISGLAAAQAAQAQGCVATVLEAAPDSGGLTRSVTIGDYTFDYTGHLLHLARCERPSQVPFANLNDDDWQQIHRKSKCYVGGKLVTAPVQYNLHELPPEIFAKVRDSYEARPALDPDKASSFREFLVAGFGQELADIFLIPQNEKTQASDLGRLSRAAVKRFFPAPDETRVRAGFSPTAEQPVEYNSRFWYPRLGGIETLVRGLTTGLEDVRYLHRVTNIDVERRIVSTTRGEVPYDVLLSSLPLKAMGSLIADQELTRLCEPLTHSTTLVFNLGVRGALPEALEGAHWIYVPDRDIPFYRVGIYSHISDGVCPDGQHALYVEVGIPGDQAARTDLVGEWQPRVLEALRRLGWVDPASIEVCAANLIRCAYVHHTPERERVIGPITDILAEHDIHPIGRYGLWDYISMEDSIHSGIETTQRILNKHS